MGDASNLWFSRCQPNQHSEPQQTQIFVLMQELELLQQQIKYHQHMQRLGDVDHGAGVLLDAFDWTVQETSQQTVDFFRHSPDRIADKIGRTKGVFRILSEVGA